MSDALEQRYAEMERSLEPQRARSIARGPIGLIGVCVVLSLAVGSVAAVDLRRLQTPRGTALAWTGSAVFGDCTAYDRLSFGGLTDAECAQLLRATREAREDSSQYGIDVLDVQQRGREATVEVEVRTPDGADRVAVPLRRRGDGWAVERTDAVCDVVRCP